MSIEKVDRVVVVGECALAVMIFDKLAKCLFHVGNEMKLDDFSVTSPLDVSAVARKSRKIFFAYVRFVTRQDALGKRRTRDSLIHRRPGRVVKRLRHRPWLGYVSMLQCTRVSTVLLTDLGCSP